MRKETPWGKADFAEELAEGIISYSTPSHGGIWLSKERQTIIEKTIPHVKNFLGSFQWWEEDCDWSVPYVLFQDDIKANGKAYHFEENLEIAKDTIKRFHPEITKEVASIILNPEKDLRDLWTRQGVSRERQDQLIAEVTAKAQPGAKIGPFTIPSWKSEEGKQ